MRISYTLFVLILCCFSRAWAQPTADPTFDVRYAQSVPYFISRSPHKLANYLTKNDTLEVQKAFSIYSWIVNNIKYDVKAAEKRKPSNYSPTQTLIRRKGVCYQYSSLFVTLCKHAGITATVISGYSRGFSYNEEDTFYESDHSWNAVKIDSAWHLVDATWGSGSVKRKKHWFSKKFFIWFDKPYVEHLNRFIQEPNYEYFMVSPEVLIASHLPSDPNWQLLEFPVSVHSFESNTWEGYTFKQDSVYAQQKNDTDYQRILEEYGHYSKVQYQGHEARQAYAFNPRNTKLLSRANLSHALRSPVHANKPHQRIEQNKKTIGYFQLAYRYANKHIQVANAENNKSIRNFQARSRKELQTPYTQRANAIGTQVAKNKKVLLKGRKDIAVTRSSIAKLKKSADKTYPALKQDISQVSIRPQGEVEEANMRIVIARDSAFALQDSISLLIRRKSDIQPLIIEKNRYLILYIKSLSSDIRHNLKFSSICKSMHEVDSIGSITDSLLIELQHTELSISAYYRAILQYQATILTELHVAKNLLYDKCTQTNGVDCDNTAYTNFNELISKVYQDKLILQKLFYDVKLKDLSFHKEFNNVLASQIKLMHSTGLLIDHYTKWRISEAEARRHKSIDESRRIMKMSSQAIESLSTTNKRLQAKARKPKKRKVVIQKVKPL